MANTPNRGYPLPDEGRTVAEEVLLLRLTLAMLDIDVQALIDALGEVEPAEHGHPMSAIEGLATALSSKMDASASFSLAGLRDVVGASEAPDGYILIKVTGGWVAQSAVAALGNHKHAVSAIVGLEDALNGMVKKSSITVSSSAPTGGADGDIHFQA